MHQSGLVLFLFGRFQHLGQRLKAQSGIVPVTVLFQVQAFGQGQNPISYSGAGNHRGPAFGSAEAAKGQVRIFRGIVITVLAGVSLHEVQLIQGNAAHFPVLQMDQELFFDVDFAHLVPAKMADFFQNLPLFRAERKVSGTKQT